MVFKDLSIGRDTGRAQALISWMDVVAAYE